MEQESFIGWELGVYSVLEEPVDIVVVGIIKNVP